MSYFSFPPLFKNHFQSLSIKYGGKGEVSVITHTPPLHTHTYVYIYCIIKTNKTKEQKQRLGILWIEQVFCYVPPTTNSSTFQQDYPVQDVLMHRHMVYHLFHLLPIGNDKSECQDLTCCSISLIGIKRVLTVQSKWVDVQNDEWKMTLFLLVWRIEKKILALLNANKNSMLLLCVHLCLCLCVCLCFRERERESAVVIGRQSKRKNNCAKCREDVQNSQIRLCLASRFRRGNSLSSVYVCALVCELVCVCVSC